MVLGIPSKKTVIQGLAWKNPGGLVLQLSVSKELTDDWLLLETPNQLEMTTAQRSMDYEPNCTEIQPT